MASTIVKKVTVGVPITGVTSGSFAITNLGGVDVTGVGEGDMLVYNATTSKFAADSDTYIKTTDSAEIKAMFSAGGDLTYNQTTGAFSFDVESVYTAANFDSDLLLASQIGSIFFDSGSAVTPSFSTSDDSGTGIHFVSSGKLGFTTSGVSQFTVENGVIAPVTDNDIDLGSPTKKFKDLYLSAGSIHIGGLILSDNNNTLKMTFII